MPSLQSLWSTEPPFTQLKCQTPIASALICALHTLVRITGVSWGRRSVLLHAGRQFCQAHSSQENLRKLWRTACAGMWRHWPGSNRQWRLIEAHRLVSGLLAQCPAPRRSPAAQRGCCPAPAPSSVPDLLRGSDTLPHPPGIDSWEDCTFSSPRFSCHWDAEANINSVKGLFGNFALYW